MVTPHHLYIYHDIADYKANGFSRPAITTFDLLIQLLKANPHVTLLNPFEIVKNIATSNIFSPFSLTLAVGNDGTKIANSIHKLTGWFPVIQTINIARREVEDGIYIIREEDKKILENTFKNLSVTSLAIVDDTVYSGLTMKTILQYIPHKLYPHTHLFCLQGMTVSLPSIESISGITIGQKMNGILERDATIIRTSSLYSPGAILKLDGAKFAFYERLYWMKAWFPQNYKEIISLSHTLRTMNDKGELHK